jgi:aerobic-type carbon monoxide dehydrogenase small subunit (CoxS/CutS family)
MHWNHRVVKIIEFDEPLLMIQEVYYNEEGKPCGYCDPCFVGDDLAELEQQVKRWDECLKQPILDAKTDFNNKFDEDDEEGKEYV